MFSTKLLTGVATTENKVTVTLFAWKVLNEFQLENVPVLLHSSTDIDISEGDELVISGQNKKNKFEAWAYKNLSTGERGGVDLRVRPLFLILQLLVSILMIYSLPFMWSQLNFPDRKYTFLFMLIFYVFFIISTLYKPCLILLAHWKLRKFSKSSISHDGHAG